MNVGDMSVGDFFWDEQMGYHTVLVIDEIDHKNKIVWATDQDGNGFEVPFARINLL